MRGKNVFMVWSLLIFVAGILFCCMANGQAKSPANPAIAQLDLNKATAEQLSKCPGLTLALARAIVDYRLKSGPFKAPEDLLKVKGITKEIIGRMKPKMDKGGLYAAPASSDDDEEEPSLKPSKC